MTHHQLSLPMATRLGYRSDNFVLHSGVKEASDHLANVMSSPSFQLAVLRGAPQSGKTHFSLYLCDFLQEQGRYPVLVEGGALSEKIEELTLAFDKHQGRIVLIDDADLYLEALRPGDSGPFVALVEACRLSQGKLLFLLDSEKTAFRYDEHVASRMLSGIEFEISAPLESEIPDLITQIAKQRGFYLSPKKIQYLSRRVGRDIMSIVRYVDRLGHLSRLLGKSAKFPLLSDAL